MKIVAVEKLEDCFDGSVIYGYTFDVPWAYDGIAYLRRLGELDYFPEFPRPFFRLRGTAGLQIKGVEGECTCRAIFPRTGKEERIKEFEECFTIDYFPHTPHSPEEKNGAKENNNGR